MNWGIHLSVCIMLLLGTWVYFLKCEINDLRRRLDEASGKHQAPEPASTQPVTAHAPMGDAHMAHAGAAAAHAKPAAPPRVTQSTGIPTWKID